MTSRARILQRRTTTPALILVVLSGASLGAGASTGVGTPGGGAGWAADQVHRPAAATLDLTASPKPPKPRRKRRPVAGPPRVDELGPAPGTSVKRRDPLMWPYRADSIWNRPLGDRADLVPLRLRPPTVKTLAIEENLLFIEPNAPRTTLRSTSAGWQRHVTRCGARTGGVIAHGLPIPSGWTTEGRYAGLTPNHSAAVVMPDLTLFESQPLHVCQDGTVVSQHAAKTWRGNSIRSGGRPGNLGSGSHGGSGLTAFGGTIRLGEWVSGGRIPHAVKIQLDAAQYLWGGTGQRHRWPAYHPDKENGHYGGTLQAARMGALLALPQSFSVSSLRTEPARILATALQSYGAYIVDDTRRSVVTFATEWGPQGRVTTQFERSFGFPMDGLASEATGQHRAFLQDLVRVYAALAVVDDNSARNIGGAGARVAPLAPPLQPPS